MFLLKFTVSPPKREDKIPSIDYSYRHLYILAARVGTRHQRGLVGPDTPGLGARMPGTDSQSGHAREGESTAGDGLMNSHSNGDG